jgi:cytoskeletal protein RodZ
MESTPGERLRKLRLEKGLSVGEICKKTKIHPKVLTAIEEDSFVNLSPIYVKGFLKIYCKFLGVDPKDYIVNYQEPKATVKIKEEIPPRVSLGFSFLKMIAKKMKIIAIVILGIVLLIVLFNLGKFVAYRIAMRSKKPKPAPVALKKPTVKPRPAAKAWGAPKKKQPPQEAPAPPKPKETKAGINLGIRAKYDNCFIELKTDGKTVFKNILQKGRFENWQAKEKIELSLGNAGAVELEIDSKLITPLGKRGQGLKNILITKEGLVVSR